MTRAEKKLRDYSGYPLDILGQCEKQIELQGKNAQGNLYVIQKDCQPLFGRAQIQALKVDMGPDFQVNQLEGGMTGTNVSWSPEAGNSSVW